MPPNPDQPTPETQVDEQKKSRHQAGVVAIVGKPNVGKSTLVNTIVGHKVSIVSDKVQTTRKRVLGIATTPDWQIVFVDTPGVHKPLHKLGATLNEAARGALFDTDAILVVVDASKMPAKEDQGVAEMLRTAGFLKPPGERKTPVLLCLNKMDKLKAEDVERNYNAYIDLFQPDQNVMTSFTKGPKGQNIDILLGQILQYIPQNPNFYPEDEFTNQPLRFLVAEIVREKALHLTSKEVPHAVATTVESWEETPTLIKIGVAILVERDGQKAILIGKKGAMLKEIGTRARTEIEDLTGKKVFLELFVKVREDWRQSPTWLKELDYL